MNGSECQFEIDTGAHATLVTRDTFQKIGFPITPSSISLVGVSGESLDVCGEANVKLQHKKQEMNATIQVVRHIRCNLLGIAEIRELGLLQLVNAVNSTKHRANVLPELAVGDRVWVNAPSDTGSEGIIVSIDRNPESFWVRVGDSNVRRDRKHLSLLHGDFAGDDDEFVPSVNDMFDGLTNDPVNDHSLDCTDQFLSGVAKGGSALTPALEIANDVAPSADSGSQALRPGPAVTSSPTTGAPAVRFQLQPELADTVPTDTGQNNASDGYRTRSGRRVRPPDYLWVSW